jgi:hypothetical protein
MVGSVWVHLVCCFDRQAQVAEVGNTVALESVSEVDTAGLVDIVETTDMAETVAAFEGYD